MHDELPRRKPLPHVPPDGVPIEGQVFFVTVCARPRGVNQLATPRAWETILETILKYQELRYWHVRRVLAMPDHLHALLSFPAEAFMKRRVASFKAWTAKAVGIRWQRDFFDHRIRNLDALEAKSAYIAHNPLRAGLCENPGDWPYQWKR